MAAKLRAIKSVEVANRKAAHKYFIGEKFTAGIVLKGTEVKAFRGGHAQIGESFVRIERSGEPFLLNAHIDEYSHGTDANHPPTRPRKLLLQRREIGRLQVAAEREGMAIVPLKMFISHGLVKIDIALCKGKHVHDKRQTLKEATEMREAARAMQSRR